MDQTPCVDDMHDFEADDCLICGKLLGYICLDCGQWDDGGEPEASDESRWCKCDKPESSFARDEEEAEQIEVEIYGT